jgi:apolipoprotein N-acyltransferase
LSKKTLVETIYLVFLGMVTSLSLPPFNYFLINFLTFSLFFIFLYKKLNSQRSKKIFFLYGWLFGFGYFASNLYWISISLTFDENFRFLIPVVILFIPALLSIFYGLVSYLFIIFKVKKVINSFFIFSLVFAIFEFIRGSILTGFPWNLIAYSFLNQLEIISITSIIGIYGFNLFCITLFSCPALLILKESNKDIGVFIFFLLCLFISYLHGNHYKKKFYATNEIIYDYKLRAIGSNISLERFYSSNNPALVIKELIEISEPNFDEKIIFIWPEGILPNVSQKELIEYKGIFENKFSKNHLLALGINKQTTEGDSKKYFNTFSIYDHELNLINSYSKVNLVPFGEFLPFENFFSMIGLKTITNNYQSYSKGNKRDIIEIKKNDFSLKILPLICYEIIYTGEIFKENNFNVIINISEDGWFGKSIGPKQHFAHSTFRSIESGKYLIRSANNGTSAIINPIGEIEKSLKLNNNGFIDFMVEKKIQPTVFSRFGNKIFGLLILLYIFLLFSINFVFSNNRNKSNLKN